MSLGSIALAVAWILRGDYPLLLKKFWQNKLAVTLCSLFILHLIGLLWTSDFNYALKDLRIKLPLLVLPFIFASLPTLDSRIIKRLLWLFVATVLFTTIINVLKYHGVVASKRDFSDPRQISTFVSHVRLSMLLCFATLFVLVEVIKDKQTRMIGIPIAGWFLFYIFHTSIIAAIIYLIVAGSLMLVLAAYQQPRKVIHLSVLLLIITVIVGVGGAVYYIADEHYTPKENILELDSTSPYGEPYHHNPDMRVLENGYYLWNNFASLEFHAAWRARTGQSLHDTDTNGNSLYLTAARYLTSKGLRKDHDGVMALTDADIQNIQHGIATIRAFDTGIKARIHAILFEIDVYRYGGNPSGHSITQRLFHWGAAIYIIKNNPFGVGTGDLPNAYTQTYNTLNSPLADDCRLRAHNQFLTMGVAFGYIGIVVFMLWILVPIYMMKKPVALYVYGFVCICALSYFWEDTLETQEGVTFVAFFSALLLLSNFQKTKKGVH